MARIVFARPPARGAFPVPNGCQIQIMWQQNGVQLRNVFHSQLGTGATIPGTAPQTVLTALTSNPSTATWLGFVHPSASLLGVGVKDLRVANMPLLTAFLATALPGTSTAQPLSQATAMAVTLRTGLSGRGFVGRAFLGGLAYNVLANARTFATGAGTGSAAGINFVLAVQQAIQGTLGSLAVFQRQLLASPVTGAPPPYNSPRAANVTNLVTGVNLASDLVNNQRRRIGR